MLSLPWQARRSCWTGAGSGSLERPRCFFSRPVILRLSRDGRKKSAKGESRGLGPLRTDSIFSSPPLPSSQAQNQQPCSGPSRSPTNVEVDGGQLRPKHQGRSQGLGRTRAFPGGKGGVFLGSVPPERARLNFQLKVGKIPFILVASREEMHSSALQKCVQGRRG